MSTGVLAESVGRGDLLMRRAVTNRWCCTWDRDEGQGSKPVDLTDWECVFELRSATGDVWYRRVCDAHGPDGKACVYIPPDAFTDRVWDGRRAGSWRMTAGLDGVVELLGEGYWSMDD